MKRRNADAEVDRVPNMFASLPSDPPPGSASVTNRLLEVRKTNGVAREIVVDGRDGGLSTDDAEQGIARYLQSGRDDFEKITIFTGDSQVTWP